MPCFFASVLHRLDRRAVGNPLGHLVPARLLLGAEVGPVEELLQAQDLDAPPRRLLDQRQVLVDHPLLDRRRSTPRATCRP